MEEKKPVLSNTRVILEHLLLEELLLELNIQPLLMINGIYYG